ncbi:peptide chain release factor N(5)-glutamine methyltransferase [Devriesea agamarum]|uniref:peptide chain release factor N(5)-glutamine methyltransferase n=1 Tax=Devriesea agamarum TaxID=472569 RepID=UPI00071C5E83|nr:peptide chain release factor N(5)-glutamine methyltransferase [Devriesea agamarum]
MHPLLRAALAEATARLDAAGVPSPAVDARMILTHALGAQGPLVLVDDVPSDLGESLEPLLMRREAREPLQLILGSAPFRRLELMVRPGVFIPRPETEVAIDLVHAYDGPCRRVIDLCTGSGALAAALLDEFPEAQVIAVEMDALAADLARENLQRVANPSRFRVVQADVAGTSARGELVAQLANADVVVSNPPYIPPGQVPVDAEVIRHDPHRALFGGGHDGLWVPAHVMAVAANVLRPGGLFVMEHADVQGEAARDLLERIGGFEDIRTAVDLSGRDRFVVAHRGGETSPLRTDDAPSTLKVRN